MSIRPSRASKARALQDRSNKGVEGAATAAAGGVAKKQRGNDGASISTVQHIDVEPTTRLTRRQSKERDQRLNEALKISASSSDLPAPSADENVYAQDNKAEIKACSSAVDSATAAKAATNPKPPTAKAKAKKITSRAKIEPEMKLPTSTSSSSNVPAIPAPSAAPVVPTKVPARRRVKRSDPCQCLEIIDPMYSLYYQQEEDYLVKPYMSAQKDINNRMRGILVDWLVEVHYKFRLQSPTLWLCVNLLDRYLEKKSLLRNKLQLLGVTCLFVACKFEEIYPPEVRDCVYITDSAYSREEVLAMEQSVLSVLEYQLCVPTGYHFLTRYLNIINANEKTRFLAFYYAERNLQESLTFNHKPSELVSAALYAALVHEVQNNSRYDSEDEDEYPHAVWPDILIEETGFDESDLLPVARVLMKHVGEEPVTTSMRHLIAAKKKYVNDKFFNVAELSLPTL